MEEHEKPDPARGLTWCKVHKYWWPTKEGCPDCIIDNEPKLNKCKNGHDLTCQGGCPSCKCRNTSSEPKTKVCEECKDHKQISSEEFEKLPFEKQRSLDCKNLVDDGQCQCYSHSHEITSEVKDES